MMRSLWTAASGMTGQQFNIDTISNNLSNVNTTGFKQNRADFEDLLYQTLQLAGTPATEVTVVPTGMSRSWASRSSASQAPDSSTPPPQIATGACAAIKRSAARSISAGSAALRADGKRSWPGCAHTNASSTSCFCTS